MINWNKKGYVIIAKDYKAEIVELEIITTINMPDDSKLFFGTTKYGDGYYNERDVRFSRQELERECMEMNKALGGLNGGKTSIYKARR